jgi:signal transduction histidine kinase
VRAITLRSFWSGIDRRRANMLFATAGLVLLVVLGLLGVQLHASQADSRQRVVSRFHDRAVVVSALTQAILSSAASPSTATRQYSGRVGAGAMDRAAAQGHLAYAALLDARGQAIASSRGLTPAFRAQLASSPAVRDAIGGAPVSLSDVHATPAGGDRAVDLVVPLDTASGRRFLVSGVPSSVFGSFLHSYLQRVPTRGGTAYVLDSHGNVIGARGARQAVGEPVREQGLAAAVRNHTIGSYGRHGSFAAVAVTGTTWHVVLTSDEATLFSSVSGARKWLPWVIYAVLLVIAAGFLAALRRLLGIAAELSEANNRLGTRNARLQNTNELLRHAAELARSNAELEQFASIASHDLQEPLRKVQTFAAQLTATESDRLSPQGQDFLQRMSNASGRMRALIDDLLAFSRVSTKGRPFVAVDLADSMSQVLGDLEVAIAESGAQVSVGELPTIDADPVQMRQLFQNLIGNALKFGRDGVTPEIDVSAAVDDGVAEVTIRDNGIGFEPRHATRIFRAFERLHGTSAYPGTGIGLALCRKIVERHHGAITAEGELGQGSRFTLRLPVEQLADIEPSPALFPETTDEVQHHAIA